MCVCTCMWGGADCREPRSLKRSGLSSVGARPDRSGAPPLGGVDLGQSDKVTSYKVTKLQEAAPWRSRPRPPSAGWPRSRRGLRRHKSQSYKVTKLQSYRRGLRRQGFERAPLFMLHRGAGISIADALRLRLRQSLGYRRTCCRDEASLVVKRHVGGQY